MRRAEPFRRPRLRRPLTPPLRRREVPRQLRAPALPLKLTRRGERRYPAQEAHGSLRRDPELQLALIPELLGNYISSRSRHLRKRDTSAVGAPLTPAEHTGNTAFFFPRAQGGCTTKRTCYAHLKLRQFAHSQSQLAAVGQIATDLLSAPLRASAALLFFPRARSTD